MLIIDKDVAKFVKNVHRLFLKKIFRLKECEAKKNRWLGSERWMPAKLQSEINQYFEGARVPKVEPRVNMPDGSERHTGHNSVFSIKWKPPAIKSLTHHGYKAINESRRHVPGVLNEKQGFLDIQQQTLMEVRQSEHIHRIRG
ncbi:unnamed protein product [Nesidiocoris tenuis]|uniref:Uncharacterized protein n=1 Tax=Nesidiocoris tenuis TaxID=355587 RepID=A0A6H5GUG3_9HEMI|nr:unnamed protein product [Nesidiocoris tenuis]